LTTFKFFTPFGREKLGFSLLNITSEETGSVIYKENITYKIVLIKIIMN